MNASPLMQLDAAPFAADFDKRPFRVPARARNPPALHSAEAR